MRAVIRRLMKTCSLTEGCSCARGFLLSRIFFGVEGERLEYALILMVACRLILRLICLNSWFLLSKTRANAAHILLLVLFFIISYLLPLLTINCASCARSFLRYV